MALLQVSSLLTNYFLLKNPELKEKAFQLIDEFKIDAKELIVFLSDKSKWLK